MHWLEGETCDRGGTSHGGIRSSSLHWIPSVATGAHLRVGLGVSVRDHLDILIEVDRLVRVRVNVRVEIPISHPIPAIPMAAEELFAAREFDEAGEKFYYLAESYNHAGKSRVTSRCHYSLTTHDSLLTTHDSHPAGGQQSLRQARTVMRLYVVSSK